MSLATHVNKMIARCASIFDTVTVDLLINGESATGVMPVVQVSESTTTGGVVEVGRVHTTAVVNLSDDLIVNDSPRIITSAKRCANTLSVVGVSAPLESCVYYASSYSMVLPCAINCGGYNQAGRFSASESSDVYTVYCRLCDWTVDRVPKFGDYIQTNNGKLTIKRVTKLEHTFQLECSAKERVHGN